VARHAPGASQAQARKTGHVDVKNRFIGSIRKQWRLALRQVFSLLPRALRFAIFRSLVACDPKPDQRLVLKIAETREELEQCFSLLHDAYVAEGYMKPSPSGLRATIYHALPTTTTLCAKYDGRVVGTLSLIRESVFGFPLQAIFDLTEIRARGGKVAEVSALAVHKDFRKTGGAILFPLMKFMYEYCTAFFDTRHLVIAVHPSRIEMYESLLFFERLAANKVDRYDFANGAPAVGATLDLRRAPRVYRQVYGRKAARRNLYAYFVKVRLPNIVLPGRRYFTTNDPVMTADLLDYFFNERTRVFDGLSVRERTMLHSIYNLPAYQKLLPPLDDAQALAKTDADGKRLRRHYRYSLKCPGFFSLTTPEGSTQTTALRVIELSRSGFLAYAKEEVPARMWGKVTIHLGTSEASSVRAMVVRGKFVGGKALYGFALARPDAAWRKFVAALTAGATHEDLDHATRFLTD
jgi:GNAT superfamily N-acetyltransferase